MTWDYSYDANGRLREVLPDGAAGAGAQRYTYNAAGYLVQVESHDAEAWSLQAQMAYNGLGQRLRLSALGVTTDYVMDGSRPLSAEAGENTTFYLYGLGPLAEKTDAWAYSLPDGTNTPRQLADLDGNITLTTRYLPGRSSGHGDPHTGRFLMREARPDNTESIVSERQRG